MAKITTEKKDEKAENLSFYSKKVKEGFITKKKNELKELFAELTEDKKQVVNPLIEELAFQFAELKDYKEIIKRDGAVEKYKNGKNQYGFKPSAASDCYNKMFKSYQSAYKQVTDFLPKSEAPKDDGFEDL